MEYLALKEILKTDIRVCNRYQARSQGVYPNAWIRWLLTFIDQDLKQLSEGDWLNLRHEATALAETAGERSAENTEELLKRGHISLDARLGVVPTQEEIMSLQCKTRKAITQLLSEGQTIIDPITLKFYIFRVDKKGACMRSSIEGSPVDKSMYKISYLLGRYGGMIDKCPECRHLFLADRKNQAYCSTKCQSRVTSRRYREKEHKSPSLKKKQKEAKHGKKGSKR